VTDIRVRKAANLAIDRAGLTKLLGGMMMEGKGAVYPGHPWFGSPTFDIKVRPRGGQSAARRGGLQTRPRKPKIKIAISTSGSGQMLPLPMNEYVQENLNAVAFDCTFEVIGVERADHLRLPAGDRRGLDQGRHQRQSTSAAPRSIPTRPSCGSITASTCASRLQLGAAEEIPSSTS